MKRILMVSTISRFLRDFLLPHAKHFRSLGWQVDALTSDVASHPECLQAFDRIWEVDWARSPFHPSNFTSSPRLVREIVEREGYDLVHVHTPVASQVTRFALRHLHRQGKTKVIYTAHGFHFHPSGSLLKNQIFYTLERIAGAWTDYLVVMNHEDEESARRGRFVPTDHLRYMPGIGVDMSYYQPEALPHDADATVYRQLGLTPDRRYFAMVAEFIPRKRHRDALLAFARLHDTNVDLVLAGSGPLEEEMKQLAISLGIAQRVHFLGFQPDVRAIVRAAYATLLPSAQEGLPRCIMESLAFSVPAIGTDIRGTRDLLQGGCGVLVPLGNINELSDAMAWILTHPEEARWMGERGRERMKNYDLGKILKQHELLYAHALDTSPELITHASVAPQEVLTP